MTAAEVVAAVLAALAVTKTFERHLPRIVVRAGIAVFVVGPLLGAAYAMWALWRRGLAPVDLAYHSMGRHPDVTGTVIRALERTGLAWDVHRPSPAAVARRRARPIVRIPAGITRSE